MKTVKAKENKIHPELLSTKDILKLLKNASIPLIFTGYLNTGYDFIKFYLISTSDKQGILVDTLQASVFNYIFVTNHTLIRPAYSMIARNYGKKYKRKSGNNLKQAWILGGLLSIPTMFVVRSAGSILYFFGQDPELLIKVDSYSTPLSFAIPALSSLVIDINFLKVCDRKALLIFQFYDTFVGLFLQLIFTRGYFGIPCSGVIGSGYAFLIHTWINFFALKLYFCSGKFKEFRLYHPSSKCLNLKKILKLGFPIYLQTSIEQVFSFGLSTIIGWLGKKSIILDQTASNYLSLFNPPIQAFKQTTQIYISQFYGMKNFSHMKRIANCGISVDIVINIIPLLVFAGYSTKLAKLVLSPEDFIEIEDEIRLVFVIKAVTKLSESIENSVTENLRAVFDSYYPFFVKLVSTLSFVIPLSYCLAFILDWELTGINAVLSIGAMIDTTLLIQRWKHINKQFINNSLKDESELQFLTSPMETSIAVSIHPQENQSETLEKENSRSPFLPLYSLQRTVHSSTSDELVKSGPIVIRQSSAIYASKSL